MTACGLVSGIIACPGVDGPGNPFVVAFDICVI